MPSSARQASRDGAAAVGKSGRKGDFPWPSWDGWAGQAGGVGPPSCPLPWRLTPGSGWPGFEPPVGWLAKPPRGGCWGGLGAEAGTLCPRDPRGRECCRRDWRVQLGAQRLWAWSCPAEFRARPGCGGPRASYVLPEGQPPTPGSPQPSATSRGTRFWGRPAAAPPSFL